MPNHPQELSATRAVPGLLLAACLCLPGCGAEPGAAPVIRTGEALTITGMTLQTALLSRFVSATNNGGSTVTATATTAQAWETFSFEDINGGSLQSGDSVYIKVGNGQYLQALNGGGSSLNAGSSNTQAWETFRVVKLSGTGTLKNGDVIGLQTSTGSYISAASGGGGAVFAYGGSLGSWEQFKIAGLPAVVTPAPAPTTTSTPTPAPTTSTPVPSGPLTVSNVTFRSALLGRYVGATNNGGSTVVATASTASAWETFSLVDVNGGSLTSGDSVYVKAGNGQYLQALTGGGSSLNAGSTNTQTWETFKIVKASGTGAIASGDTVGLQTNTGSWLSAENGGGGSVFAYGGALGSWESFVYASGTVSTPTTPPTAPGSAPDFGPNVLVFDPSMSTSAIQSQLNTVFAKQESNQFGTARYAYLFKPGSYDVDVQVGFYMHVIGLGQSPDDVKITGAVRSKATWFQGNATQNFWRAAKNLSITPTQDNSVNVWAVSQGTALRRIHVKGALALSDGGWSSGGFIADSKIDTRIDSGSQQQFFARNSALGSWQGGSWNMVFVGDQQAPASNWPGAYTTIASTPTIAEKPYLALDASGNYVVNVPAAKLNSAGPSWTGSAAVTALPIAQFYVAHLSDSAATINAQLAAGKNLLLTPGVYHLTSSLQVTRPNTVILGIGYPTLEADQGSAALTVSDVDGVKVSGILVEAGAKNSSTLLQLGDTTSGPSHAANPTVIHDIFCRIGGAQVGLATTCVTVNSNDVVMDDLWLWRADHGNGVDWYGNKSAHGLIVNGANVTAYGLFVEHFQEYQTVWNGNGGRVYFYQSELPYDVPSQSQWTHDGVNGFASYKVAANVTGHQAYGLGVYCAFYYAVREENAFETPGAASMNHLVTEWLGFDGNSQITHVHNDAGAAATSTNGQVKTSY